MIDRRIVVVGAGPAGLMAAIRAAELGAEVILLEKKATPGNKLLLSGKGRCNLTNVSSIELFFRRFSRRGEFLRDAFSKFSNQDLIDFFQNKGLKLKIERQERVFPVSDRAASVIEVLKKELIKKNIDFRINCGLKDLIVKNNVVSGVLLSDGSRLAADKVILATGGVTYSFTGSDGFGLAVAEKLGHKVISLRPGLIALTTKEKIAGFIQGLTLKNIRIKFECGRKVIESEIGELIFTDFGVSGPLVLTLSAKVVDYLREKKEVVMKIDLKPALSLEQIDARLIREFKANSKKNLDNVLKELLPKSLVKFYLLKANIEAKVKVSQLTQEERKKIGVFLKAFPLLISGRRPFEEAMVTQGGVDLKEIDPRTMQSRLIKGLYFCGEMIDLDADTGGFNLQAAFSTGYLAGESAAI